MAKHQTGATMIALRQQTVAGRDFLPGDKFDVDGITDRKLRQMVEIRFIGPLTRDSYQASMKRREPGAVGAGFTLDGLMAMGIIDSAEPEPTPTPAGEWAPDPKEYAVSERYGDFWLAGNKRGPSVRYDVFDLKGGRVNAGGTMNGPRQVKGFVDKVVATAKEEAEKAAAAGGDADAAAETETITDPLQVPAIDSMTDAELREMLTEAGLEPKGDESREDLLSLVKMLPPEKVLFTDFPESLDDWTAEHDAAFDKWFEGLPETDTVYRLTNAAGLRFAQKRADNGGEEQQGGTDDSNLQPGSVDPQG